MFYKPRSVLAPVILIVSLGLSACGSLFGTAATPTVNAPTLTPEPLATPTATPPPLAATVNGEYITLAEFEAELARYQAAQQAQGKEVTVEEAGQAVLEDLIAQVLLAQAASEAGFTLTEADLQLRMDALAAQSGGAEALSKWETDHGYSEASFRTALKRSIEAAWMRDKIIANVPAAMEQAHIQQILTYNEEDAQLVLEELKAGADFAEKAALYDPITRGELGWLPRGYLLDANVEAAVFSLEAGATSDVIASPAGFHIIKVLERDMQRPLSPGALLVMQEQALLEWVRQARAQSSITLAP